LDLKKAEEDEERAAAAVVVAAVVVVAIVASVIVACDSFGYVFDDDGGYGSCGIRGTGFEGWMWQVTVRRGGRGQQALCCYRCQSWDCDIWDRGSCERRRRERGCFTPRSSCCLRRIRSKRKLLASCRFV